jgi:TrmH family RNA methyltransferase
MKPRTHLITSRENPGFRHWKKLAHSARERRKAGVILLEGWHLIETWQALHGLPGVILINRAFAGRMKDANDASRYAFLGDAPLCLADALFMELAQTQTPDGILAFAQKPVPPEAPLLSRDSLLLDGIQDPGNLGTLLRTAAAAGMYQVLLSTDCVDAWSPKVLRAGQGAHFQIRIHEEVDLPAFLADFQGDGLATTLEDAPSLYSSAWQHPVAWVFGSEGQGVRPQVLAAARQHLHIPMPGKVESLNVAAAAAICLFEMVRRRLDAG